MSSPGFNVEVCSDTSSFYQALAQMANAKEKVPSEIIKQFLDNNTKFFEPGGGHYTDLLDHLADKIKAQNMESPDLATQVGKLARIHMRPPEGAELLNLTSEQIAQRITEAADRGISVANMASAPDKPIALEVAYQAVLKAGPHLQHLDLSNFLYRPLPKNLNLEPDQMLKEMLKACPNLKTVFWVDTGYAPISKTKTVSDRLGVIRELLRSPENLSKIELINIRDGCETLTETQMRDLYAARPSLRALGAGRLWESEYWVRDEQDAVQILKSQTAGTRVYWISQASVESMEVVPGHEPDPKSDKITLGNRFSIDRDANTNYSNFVSVLRNRKLVAPDEKAARERMQQDKQVLYLLCESQLKGTKDYKLMYRGADGEILTKELNRNELGQIETILGQISLQSLTKYNLTSQNRTEAAGNLNKNRTLECQVWKSTTGPGFGFIRRDEEGKLLDPGKLNLSQLKDLEERMSSRGTIY